MNTAVILLTPYFLCLAISSVVGILCWRRKHFVSRLYGFIALSQASCTFGLILEMLSASMDAKIFWDNMEWIGIAGWNLGFVAFTLEYCGFHVKRPWQFLAALSLPATLFIFLVFTDSWHGLVRHEPVLVSAQPFSMLMYGFTTLDLSLSAVFYLYFFVCILLLIIRAFRQKQVYRIQAVLIVIGNLIPILGTLLIVTGSIDSIYRDITPFAFALGNLFVFFAMNRHGLFDIIPIAREWVVERLDDAVIVLDRKFRIVDVNQAAMNLSTSSHAVGLHVEAVYPVFGKSIKDAGNDSAGFGIEIGESESRRNFEVKVQALFDAKNGRRGSVAILRDITARKKMESEVAAYRVRLENLLMERSQELSETFKDLVRKSSEMDVLERNLRRAGKMEAMGLLAGGIAHDFNNLLAPILGFAELAVLEARNGRDVLKYLEEITTVSQSAAKLVNQIWIFSRAKGPETSVFDISALIREKMALLKRFLPENIAFKFFDTGSDMPIKGDKTQIEQVLINLCINARDAMPEGGTLSFTASRVEGPSILIQVADSGHGMDQATQQRIFEPFFTTKEIGKGTGMGLPTVQRIVEQHGGRIELESQPGRGTEFRIYFPHAPQSAEKDSGSVESGAGAFSQAEGGTETILVVEDDDLVRRLACEALRAFGYSALEAIDGASAQMLSVSHSGAIHLLLTDVKLPGVAGPDLFSLLAASRPELRVLYMSGYTESNMKEKTGNAGFIRKPFYISELLTGVRNNLSIAGHVPQP